MRTYGRARLVAAGMVLVPLVEIVVFILLGQAIGFGWTLLGIFALSVAGVMVIRQQGAQALGELRSAVGDRRNPEEMSGRLLTMAGGVLLAIPGFVTAVASVAFFLPFTRPLIRATAGKWAVGRGAMTVTGYVRRDDGSDGVVRGDVLR